MPEGIITTEYRGMMGVNNTLHPEIIAEQELADALNYHPKTTGQGVLIKRCGHSAAAAVESTGATFVTSMYGGQRNRYFTFYDTAGIHIYDLDDGTTSLYTTAATQTQGFGSWASIGAYDIFVDGATKVYTSNGTAFSALTNCPAYTNVVAPYNNFLFGLKYDDYDKLFWSDLLDPLTWPAENYVEIGLPTVFDRLTSLRVWQDRLVIWTVHGFYVMHGYSNTDWTISYAQNVAGTHLHSTTMATAYGLLWWNQERGICISRDGYNVEFPMMGKLGDTLADCGGYINKYNASAMWRPDKQCASFYVRDSNASYAYSYCNLRIDYYPASNSFWLHRITDSDSSGVHCCGAVEKITTALSDEPMKFYVGRKLTGTASVWVEDETLSQDVGSAITSTAKFRRATYGTPLTNKRSSSAMVTVNAPVSGTVTYSYFRDNDTTATNSFDYTAASGISDKLYQINVNHRKLQHQVSDAINGRTELICIAEDTTVENQL